MTRKFVILNNYGTGGELLIRTLDLLLQCISFHRLMNMILMSSAHKVKYRMHLQYLSNNGANNYLLVRNF